MFARLATVLLLALSAIAIPTNSPSCSTGEMMCCNEATKTGSTGSKGILGTLVSATLGATVPVAVQCNPITAIGVGGQSCTAQTACCARNTMNGLVNVACTPINVVV